METLNEFISSVPVDEHTAAQIYLTLLWREIQSKPRQKPINYPHQWCEPYRRCIVCGIDEFDFEMQRRPSCRPEIYNIVGQ